MRALRVTTTYHIASRRIQEKRATRYTRVLPFNDLLKHRKTIYLSLAPCVLCVLLLLLLLLFLIITPHTHTHTHARCARKYFKKVLNISKKLQLFFFAVKKKKLSKTSFSRQCIARCVFRWSDFAFFFFAFLALTCVCVRAHTNKKTKKKKKVNLHSYICLVDPASSHMLVSKTKPCMSKYNSIYMRRLRISP